MSVPGANDPSTPRQGSRHAGGKPFSLTPSDRLAEMTRERIISLEEDKTELTNEIVQLRGKVDRLGPENARMREALSRAESNSLLATILVLIGGFLVSYASFTGESAKWWANLSLGLLIAGIALMTW